MTDRQNDARQPMEVLYDMRAEGSELSFSDFVEVSDKLFGGYCDLLEKGGTPPAIAMAMLGTTVNLYRLFEMEGDLAPLLRAIANDLDCPPNVH